jgi:hypothetical protein
MPATCGRWAPHWRQSMRSFHHSPTRTPCSQMQHVYICSDTWSEPHAAQPGKTAKLHSARAESELCSNLYKMNAHRIIIQHTVPRGSCSGGIGPKWSCGVVTMMRPLAALARPERTC